MPLIESIMNRGFSNGQPWDRTPLRKAVMLYVLPACALLIAVAGALIIHERLSRQDPVGYVVSNDADCALVVSDRRDGPPVATIEQNRGGRLGTCGGLDVNQEVFYDPARGVQTFGDDDTRLGFVAVPLFALLAGVPGALAWTHTLQKRRARRRGDGSEGRSSGTPR